MSENVALAVVGGTDIVPVDTTAEAIGAVFERGKSHMVDSVNYLLECGRMLIEAKRLYGGHGQWLPWLAANEEALGFGRKTAAKLMSAARKCLPSATFEEGEALQISRTIWGHDVGERRTLGINNNEWYTPGEYIEVAREVLGDIDLDPASCEFAQRTVQARNFYTKEDDGLTKPWHGRIFLNPPYSRDLLSRFVDKLIAERNAKRVKAAILLTHNFSDTGWFQKAGMFCQAVCFTRGRVCFVSPNEQYGAGPAYGQAFMYFGPDTGKFFDVFSEKVGLVLRP